MKLLLASQSPRRKDLLQQLGYDFETVSVSCEETFPAEMPAHEVAPYLSQVKADAYGSIPQNSILITADTVVVLDERILGKPDSTLHAKEMLEQLSGRTHQVYTGVTVKTSDKSITVSDVAHVTFAHLDASEIEFYIENFKPLDKAGAYGIQDWLGMAKITSITGSFYTVMGLPTHLLYSIIKELSSVSAK